MAGFRWTQDPSINAGQIRRRAAIVATWLLYRPGWLRASANINTRSSFIASANARASGRASANINANASPSANVNASASVNANASPYFAIEEDIRPHAKDPAAGTQTFT